MVTPTNIARNYPSISYMSKVTYTLIPDEVSNTFNFILIRDNRAGS